MRPPKENPAERLKRGRASKLDQIGVVIIFEPTENLRSLQAFRVALRFGLLPNTVTLIAGLAYPALVSTEAYNG